jgi:hypothetical protein
MTFVCRPLERKSGGNDEGNVASAHASFIAPNLGFLVLAV